MVVITGMGMAWQGREGEGEGDIGTRTHARTHARVQPNSIHPGWREHSIAVVFEVSSHGRTEENRKIGK